jgi:DnaJ-class molecular chaperone
MKKQQHTPTRGICPDCQGRGMIRAPGEWYTETCPRCDGRGEIETSPPAAAAGREEPAPTKR